MIRVLALLLALSAPAMAECRLALTLALDVSSSVDAREYRLQLEGVARALEDREVRDALFAEPGASVALQVFEWSGVQQQRIVQDWILLNDMAALETLTARLRDQDRAFGNAPTALGSALAFALMQLRRMPDCRSHKIDVSGDGQNNVGRPPQTLVISPAQEHVTINGLAIESDETALGRYYRHFVTRGPGSFVVAAADFDDYARAMREKLIREIGVPRLGALR
ncbi:DUF1194 domain-containing protein [Halovulum sp. GXIMD14794]